MAQTRAATVSTMPAGSSGDFPPFNQKHLLSIADLKQHEIIDLLDRAERMVPVSRQERKSHPTLSGKTQINLFFESSTRTQGSFEIAGKRLGALVMNMSVKTSSVSKGETLIDTAATLNAMRPDVIVVRHSAAGAVELLSQKVGCSVINAGDGAHEHPTQALLDATADWTAQRGNWRCLRRSPPSALKSALCDCGLSVHPAAPASGAHAHRLRH